MNRRRFLSVTVGAVAGISGCGSTGSSPTAPAPTMGKRTTAPETTTSIEPTTVPETDARVAVSIETSRYLVRSFAQDKEQRAIEPDEITPLGEISEPLRSALETAVEGVFKADEVGKELLAGIDRFRHHGGGYRFEPYFSVNGIPYAFDPTVPELVASLKMDVEDADPDQTITGDDLDGLAEPAAEFVRTLGAYYPMVSRDEYRISVVPPSVEALLDRYDYVRDPSGVGRIVAKRVDPGPPYTIHADELTADEIWGRPVLSEDSLPTELQQFVRAVVTSNRRTLVYPASRTEYRTDDLPPSYYEHLGADQAVGSGPYAEIDGTMYAFRVTEVRREHVPLDVSVTSDSQDTFAVTVAPSQAGSKPAFEGPVEVESPWSVPGPLWVHSDDKRHRLDRVETVIGSSANDASRPVTDAETVSLPGDNELVATYRVPPEVPSGTYRAWGLVRVSWAYAESDRPSLTRPFPFTVALTVPEA